MSLRRPFFLLILAALLPLVLLSALIGAAWIRDQQQVLGREAIAKVDRTAALIDRELLAQIDVLRAMADAPLFDGPLDATAIERYAARLQDHQPLWRVVVVSDLAGNWIVSRPETPGGPGRIIEIESHDKAVASGLPAIGSIRHGGRGIPSFAVRVPVVRDGKVLYVLSAVIIPDAVGTLLLATGLPPTWIGAVVDGEGRLAARTSGAPEHIGDTANPDTLHVLKQRRSGLYEGRVLEGWSAIFAFQTIPSSGWSVHLAIPREDYVAPLRRSAWVLGLGGTASLTIAALLVVLLWREVRRRREEETAREETHRLEALGLMTGGVAHDFNNLLMIVQGSAEAILLRSADQDRVRTYAEAVLVATRRGQGLTRQLLAFGRRSPYLPVGFDLRDRADDLLTLLKRSTRGDIATELDLSDGLWRIHADPDALEVALVNLAVNARDAMPSAGNLTIRARNVSLSRRHDEGTGLAGDFVAITVSDTGCGMDEEVQHRIFEPFFTTKPPGKGTGLGLSQVFGFAKQSGGAVTVASRPGKGTSITIYLPRSLQETAPRDPPPPPCELAGRRILIVEDNPEVARVASEMLRAAGLRVEWVDGAAAALPRLEQEAFDLLLSDVMMEGLSGLELAELAEARWPALPILLMTGYSEAIARGQASRWPLITKPFSEAQILAAIETILAKVTPDDGPA
jgi:signal transduction histidine kinase/CheY-like chemotaxis protein